MPEDSQATPNKPLYGRKQFAAALKDETGVDVSPRSLEKYATTGGGPPYVIFSRRAYYDLDEGIAWVRSRMSAPRRNTSESRANAA